MNRREFQEISRIRRKEAYTLLRSKHCAGAYYLLGYAVECALKACIAKQTRRYDFPNKALAQSVYTHDLKDLLGFAGLGPQLEQEMKTNKPLGVNWSVVTLWKEDKRYSTSISMKEAEDLYSACTSRRNGILN